MVQRKATIPLQLDGQFDSHLYEGRQVQMVLSTVDRSIGETSIEVERMAEVARSAPNHSSIIKLPLSGAEFFVKLYIKLFSEANQSTRRSVGPQPSIG